MSLFPDAKPASSRATTFAEPQTPDLSGFVQVGGVQQQTAVVVQQPFTAIVVTDEMIDKLGEKSSQSVSKTSQMILAGTKASQVDELGGKLNELIATTKKLDPTKMGKPGFFGKIFGAASSVKEKLLAEYQTVEQRMNALAAELDAMRALMDKRVTELEAMYHENEALYKNLGAEIEQGRSMVEAMRQQIAATPAPTDPLEAQRLNDFTARMQRLEKRVDDLHRGQQLILMSLPEIRLEQNNKRALAASVQTIKRTTIPAWQGVFSRYILGLESKKGAEIVNSVYDATDEAFKQQADLLRANTVAVAQTQQRAVVSIETMVHCRDQLLGALDDAKRIAIEGQKARDAARPQLEAMEQGLIARFQPSALISN